MLLQLVYDEMMHRKFGDIGAYQFWIPPDDLAQGNWAAMRLTSKAIDELTPHLLESLEQFGEHVRAAAFKELRTRWFPGCTRT